MTHINSLQCTQCVSVQLKNLFDAAVGIALIAASKIPSQGKAAETREHSMIALNHLQFGQHAAQRVINMRVSTGLVDEEVSVLTI